MEPHPIWQATWHAHTELPSLACALQKIWVYSFLEDVWGSYEANDKGVIAPA